MSNYPHIVWKKHTFLSALAMGLSAIVITLIICCSVVILYGVHFAGDKSEELVSLVQNTIRGLPDLQESLPPILADVLDDRRQPDYCDKLEITAKTILQPDRDQRLRTMIEVINNGKEVVSLLSMRIIILDEHNEILTESNEWAATPFAADRHWRGPIMPGSRRYFACSCHRTFPVSYVDDLRTEVEVTDVRIWNAEKDTLLLDEEISSETDESDSHPKE